MTVRRSGPRSAITLFEVVIALVIFVMTLPALNALVQLGTQRAQEAQMISQASLHCRSKLAEVMVGAEPLEGVEWSPLGDANWQWRMDVVNGEAEGLKVVQVWARFDVGGGQTIEATLSQMIVDPAIRGSTQDRALLDTANAATTPTEGTEGETGAQSGSTNNAGTGGTSKTGTNQTGGASTGNTSKTGGTGGAGGATGGRTGGTGTGNTGGRTGGGGTGGTGAGGTGGRTGGTAPAGGGGRTGGKGG